MYGRLSVSLVAELIGTFALIFIGAGAVALIAHPVAIAFAHGLVVVSFAYAYGHHSGAHINPAVTLGVWVAGKIDAVRAISYIVVQCVGGVLGALVLRWVLDGTTTSLGVTKLAQNFDVHGSPLSLTPGVGIVVEAILTFFLVNAVMNAGISGKATIPGGLSIGLTLTAAILMGLPLTGASLNPARSLGPAVAAADYGDLWVYLVGPPLGGIVAGLLYKGFFEERAVSASGR
ncbi:MAG TPA: aquaporin [Thermoanaerobaculia bacterium]|nr:aquaporin [Thermoanaerobaculia bacterium]